MGETCQKYGRGEVNTVYWWLVGKNDRKTSLERRRRRWKNNVTREAITYGVILRHVRGTTFVIEKQ
jgi:hypothetical protein